jgi:hypothetical protein
MAAIPSYDGTRQAQLWKQAFERSYRVSYEILKHEWRNVPDEFLLMLNCRASVDCLDFWGKSKNVKRGEKIVQCIDDIISEWDLNPSNLFENGSKALKLLNEIREPRQQEKMSFLSKPTQMKSPALPAYSKALRSVSEKCMTYSEFSLLTSHPDLRWIMTDYVDRTPDSVSDFLVAYLVSRWQLLILVYYSSNCRL